MLDTGNHDLLATTTLDDDDDDDQDLNDDDSEQGHDHEDDNAQNLIVRRYTGSIMMWMGVMRHCKNVWNSDQP